MKRLLLVLCWLVALSLVFVQVAGADNGATTGDEGTATVSVALALTPLVAAATAIERVIEMLFNGYESLVLSIGGFAGLGGSYVKWAREQVSRYRNALISASSESEVSRLEELLLDAQQRLKDSLKAEPYVSLKRAFAVLLGIALGLVAAFTTRLQMFRLLGVDLSAMGATTATTTLSSLGTTMDMAITGVVIGTGSAPVHSFIGILQNTKDAIDQVRALAQGRSIAAITGILPSTTEPGAFGKRGTLAAEEVEEGPSRVEIQRTARRLLS
jgi:hypothetical protein